MSFADPRFERPGSISVGHLYNLRNCAPYRAQRVMLSKTRPTKAATIAGPRRRRLSVVGAIVGPYVQRTPTPASTLGT